MHTRRHVLTTGLLGFIYACSELKALARTSSANCAASVTGVDWDCFVENLEKAASRLHAHSWDMEHYVNQVSLLLRTLRLTDPSLARWESTYRDDHFGEPEFEDLRKSRDFQVTMISFEPGDFIPHHDHPGMTGVTFCAVGELLATNYDLIESNQESRSCLLRQTRKSVLMPGATSALTARHSNIHIVRANRFTQVIDIFAPPYDDVRISATRWYELEEHPVERRSDIFRARF